MKLLAIPVVNGVLPRPDGGSVRGLFMDPHTAEQLDDAGEGGNVFLCPFVPVEATLYPVGVLSSIEQLWQEQVHYPGRDPERGVALFARVSGRALARARGYALEGRRLYVTELELVDPDELRSRGYPVICGAGWQAAGGETEMKAGEDLPVRIYGVDLEDGNQVFLEGNLGGVVTPEVAHTVEHAIIRSLRQYALCTPKTLARAMAGEARELKDSIEMGIELQRPEIFGVTSTGACGNPLTNLAQFYLAEGILNGLSRGQSLAWSLDDARRRTLSRLTQDLELSATRGLRALQGLKFGMRHDDTCLPEGILKKVISRFPPSPWH